jgi:AraC-like DNA-binding protein
MKEVFMVSKLHETWELSPSIRPRSQFISLEPIGMKTTLMESLTGYISRLAEVHCLNTGTFISKVISPRLEKYYLNQIATRGGNGFYDWAHSLNGLGNGAKEFVVVLQELTLRNDLTCTTLLDWVEVIPTRGLSRAIKAWCPVCYQEWRDQHSIIYDPLIWSLQEVSICSKHVVRLCTKCPNPQCAQSMPWLNRCSRPGYCSKCGSWLGQNIKKLQTVEESKKNWEMFKCEMLGQLISVSLEQETCSNNNVSIILKRYVDIFTDGNFAAFSRKLNVPKNTLLSWYSGSVTPSISSLLKVCYCLQITLIQLLTEKAHNLPLNQFRAPDIVPKKVKFPRNKESQDFLEKALNNIINQNQLPPPSIANVASRLGYDRRLLSRRFPEHCKTLSERYLAYQKSKGQERIQQLTQEVIETTRSLYSRGIYPSRRKVEELVSIPGVIEAIRQARHHQLEELGLRSHQSQHID